MAVYQARTNCDTCGGKLSPCNFNRASIALDAVGSFNVTDQAYGTSLPLVTCDSCGLVQTRDNLPSSAIQSLYDTPDPHYLATATARGLSNFLQVKKALQKTGGLPKNIFEIGAGSGAMLHYFKQTGCAVAGIETNPLFCAFAKQKYDVTLTNGDSTAYAGHEQFDVVAAIDVIEHMTSVTSFMSAAEQLVKPGGRLVLVTPNRASVVARIAGKRWWHIRPPHLFYLSPKDIETLGKKYNLRMVYQSGFSWRHTLGYLLDCAQALVFRRVVVPCSWLKIPVYINTLDSCLVVLQK